MLTFIYKQHFKQILLMISFGKLFFIICLELKLILATVKKYKEKLQISSNIYVPCILTFTFKNECYSFCLDREPLGSGNSLTTNWTLSLLFFFQIRRKKRSFKFISGSLTINKAFFFCMGFKKVELTQVEHQTWFSRHLELCFEYCEQSSATACRQTKEARLIWFKAGSKFCHIK